SGLRIYDRGKGGQVRDTPAVDDLGTERDLVVALQVTPAVRVAVLDHLESDPALHTPPDGGEIPDKRQHVGRRGGHADSADGVRYRRPVSVQLGYVGRQPEVRVELLLGVGPAQRRELGGERRVQGDVAGDRRAGEHQLGRRVEVGVRLVRRSYLHLSRGLRQVFGHRWHDRAAARVDGVEYAEVQGARQGRLDQVENLRHHPELVVFIGPHHLVRPPDGFVKFERLDRLD